MNLLARIKADDVGFLSFIDDDEVKETVNGGLFVSLRRTENDLWLIPEELRSVNSTLYVECEERQKNGVSRVVCGLSGKPLKANPLPAFGAVRGGVQGDFFIPLSVVAVECAAQSDVVSIVLLRAVREGTCACIMETVIWEGEGNLLPRAFSKFSSAVLAALKKSGCTNCSHVHFQSG